ncbi:hypothetical protein OAO65_02135 [Flavobacteriales bacterium]|nr:hypothetical protein [Flavobacteriales bacterium]
MNLLETLVYNLPEKTQKKVLDISEKSEDCCTVNCDSIDAIDDYITELTEIVKAVAHIGVDFGYGKFELNEEHVAKARQLIE